MSGFRLSHKSRKMIKQIVGETMDKVDAENAIGVYVGIAYVEPSTGELRLRSACRGINSSFAQATAQGVIGDQLLSTLGSGEVQMPTLDAAKKLN